MAGINRYEGKDRRRQRLRNHIAKDLRSPKYAPRVIPGRKLSEEPYEEYEDDNDE